jgi:ribokinase
MVGRVGGDIFGFQLKEELGAAGVDHLYVAVDPDVSSGVAVIAVEDSAENFIIVIPGANGRVENSDLEKLENVLADANVLLLQLEIPLEAVLAAAEAAHSKGVTVILDPAPARELPDALYPLLDWITPNEREAELLVSFPIETQAGAARAAAILQERGVGNVIIKMGRRGAFALMDDQSAFFDAFVVNAVDTVAAGDAFNGALAVALSQGQPLHSAVRWGLAGGALSVTKAGAQPAMPRRADLLAFLKRHS